MSKSFAQELEKATATAYEVGRLQLRHRESPLRVIRKAVKEFVSHVDMECQQLSVELLGSDPSCQILSEEVRGQGRINTDRFWVVDPLDGTHNYIAGLPLFGVSIGLVCEARFVLGAIYLPFFEKLYYAVRGHGAYCNGVRIHVSRNKTLEKSMITYDNQFYLCEKSITRFQDLAKSCFTTRILGSAVCDFSLIASAKVDARVWNHTKIFDFAAGVVIVEEAGGRVTDFQNKPVTTDSTDIVASNGLIHEDLLTILRRTA